ncbi:MAG TPA: hypothetical protein VFS01_12185 [Rhizomicrobium sp.]|jgi:hypothetical protein|nr:hypothetical protein [Rhizomicrobium sp.]
MAKPAFKDTVLASKEFLYFFGMFHAAWASVDSAIDMLIGKHLKIEPVETHILTSGMMFGAKARLLRELVRRGTSPNKPKIIAALNNLQNKGKRNQFAHSYIGASATEVCFLERLSGGDFAVKEHTFTLETFKAHVKSFTDSGKDLWNYSGLTAEDQAAFFIALEREVKSS